MGDGEGNRKPPHPCQSRSKCPTVPLTPKLTPRGGNASQIHPGWESEAHPATVCLRTTNICVNPRASLSFPMHSRCGGVFELTCTRPCTILSSYVGVCPCVCRALRVSLFHLQTPFSLGGGIHVRSHAPQNANLAVGRLLALGLPPGGLLRVHLLLLFFYFISFFFVLIPSLLFSSLSPLRGITRIDRLGRISLWTTRPSPFSR